MSVNLTIVEKLIRDDFQDGDLPSNIADWPEEWREEFEERAAIMEFDGNLDCEEAEQWAETIVRAAYRLHRKQGGDHGRY